VTDYGGQEERTDRFTALEEMFAGYTVYDRDYEKIGKVDDLFVGETDQPEYIGVKMGFLGTRSTLIPMEIVRVNDERELVEVSTDKETVKNGPTFDDDSEITPSTRTRSTPTMSCNGQRLPLSVAPTATTTPRRRSPARRRPNAPAWPNLRRSSGCRGPKKSFGRVPASAKPVLYG
jgi:rRNA processing protein Gar1